ncbi:DNA-binding protein rif1 [Homalodisca vitripennis]|nr:DNA-binding protein rif1 [Homalodisca vitripennis]
MCSVTRALNGPSEDWVRRTYSPTASPNSSILKRRADPQPLSPDCSPPSNKKKRVSFLDPPVSESLLFCKRTPGKGQIQRPEPKQESESEDVPSQGSVQLICPVDDAKNQLQASVYSPLKQCSDPLSTVLERIVSVQWASELESQLLRLGVTTVGQLSALTGATVERLPFIPPKLERLRKILQNYDNEINEREESSKTECMSLDEEEECVTPPIDEISNAIAPSEEAAPSEFEASTKIPLMAGNTSSMAEQIKSSIESNPDLISELGQRLDVDIIMSILKCAVTKLKTQDDTR